MIYEILSEALRIGLPTTILFVLIVAMANHIITYIEKKTKEIQRRENRIIEREKQQKEVDEARKRIDLK